MRTYVIEALRYFNQQRNDTTNFPDSKRISNLRAKVEEYLFRKYPDHYERYSNGNVDKRLNENNRNSFLEAVHFLTIEGIIMGGNAFDSDTDSFPYFSITSYGKRALESKEGEITPHDPENYIANLKERIKHVDDITLIYLQESLQCHFRGNYIASSVMLGVASEATLNLIFNWMLNNVTDPNLKIELENLRNRSEIKKKFRLIYRELERVKNQFNFEIRDNMDSNLNGIFNLIRTQRNDSGHPTGKRISRDNMFINLRIFPAYCETVHKILSHLKKNKGTLF